MVELNMENIVKACEFDIEGYGRGVKVRLWISVCQRAGGGFWSLPVLIIRGDRPGPRLSILGGIHGDEYDGPEVIHRLFERLSVTELCGTVVMVPVCNVPAYEACRRISPIDGANMARVFPGDVGGTVTQQLAYWVGEFFIRGADALIDIHSGGLAYNMPTLVGCQYSELPLDVSNVQIARSFGAPVLWMHPNPVPSGRTVSLAAALGVPAIYTEAAGAGRVGASVVDCFVRGVTNVMRYLGMLDSLAENCPPPHELFGGGNLDVMITAPCAGHFRSDVMLMDNVRSGQRMGAIYDLAGCELGSLFAHRDGVVVTLRGLHRVDAGDGIYHITGERSTQCYL